MLFRLIENGEERVEAALVDGDAAVIERKRHRLQFPPEFGRTSTRAAHGCTESVTLSTSRGCFLGAVHRWLAHRPRLRAGDDGGDFERHAAVAPAENPGLKEV